MPSPALHTAARRTMAFALTALTALTALSVTSAALAAQPDAPVIGRWDLTVQGANGPYPSWVEVTLSGHRTLVGRFVGGGGSARPIAKVKYVNNTMTFAIPPQWEAQNADLQFEATWTNDQLRGTMITPDGERQAFTGVRAPLLRRSAPPTWSTPVTLFNGKDLAGWEAFAGDNQWKAVNGVLTNTKAGGNLKTTRQFTDFTLHIEFRYPKGGNSGVYLRGRHEVQVEDSGTAEPLSVHLGGVYGFLAANENASKGPDEWQTYDITLIGRRVTVILNGTTVIADQVIPGITGGALDSNEGAPGPIYLQGDHGPVEYRHIVITPVR